ncbi:MAG: hypothetical protein APF82_03865 [Sphingomonadales bacterium BRH_c42]|nr:MAG: hypothetical protein APF82_03865 [Sphingomonadales bacterium BRH_c42]
MRALFACCAAILLGLPFPASATPTYDDIAFEWEDFQIDLEFGEEPDWSYLGGDYSWDIGLVKDAYWVVAWRNEELTGVYLRYEYAEPVSPPELPGDGPMQSEEVEVTFDCSRRTVQIHSMYLFRPDRTYIGQWFDDSVSRTPTTFDDGSIMGQAFAKVC